MMLPTNHFWSQRIIFGHRELSVQQRVLTHKLWSGELWSLCTAGLHYKIYPIVKFQVNSLNSIRPMLRTKKYGRTDKAATKCSPLDSIKIYIDTLHYTDLVNAY